MISFLKSLGDALLLVWPVVLILVVGVFSLIISREKKVKKK